MNRGVLRTEIPPLLEVKKKAAGKKGLIDLSQAVPGYSMPDELSAHLTEVIADHKDNRVSFYTPDPGDPGLLNAVAEYESEKTGRRVNTDELIITSGANQAFYITATTLFNRGDKVAVFAPYYFNHCMTLDILGIEKQIIYPKNGVEPDIERLFEMNDIAGVIIVNPSNPTGYCLSEDVLDQITDFVCKKNIFLISDETYQEFDDDFIPASRKRRSTIISLKSFSKTYSLTGFRVGYLQADPGIIEQMLKVQDCNIICAPHISQLAALYCLKDLSDEWLEEKKRILEKNMHIISKKENLPHGMDLLSVGAFFSYISTGRDSMEVTEGLIENGVLVAPGEVFEGRSTDTIRVSTGNVGPERLMCALERLVL